MWYVCTNITPTTWHQQKQQQQNKFYKTTDGGHALYVWIYVCILKISTLLINGFDKSAEKHENNF